jgi:ATP-dependent protease ClpP protease subunit
MDRLSRIITSLYTVIAFLVLAATTLTCTTLAESADQALVTPPEDRTLYLEGTVDQQMLDLMQGPGLAMVMASSEPIHLVIDSPGGNVDYLYPILDLMVMAKQRGIRYICYVPRRAQSAGFSILAHCDTRLGLPGATYLIHRIRLLVSEQTSMTVPQLQGYLTSLIGSDQKYLTDLHSTMADRVTLTRLTEIADRDESSTGEDIDTYLGKGWLTTTHLITPVLYIPPSVPRPVRAPSGLGGILQFLQQQSE